MGAFDLLTLGVHGGFTGMVAPVSAGATEYAVLEIQAPANRNLFVTTVIVFGGATSYPVIMEQGPNSFIPSGGITIAHDSLSHLSGDLVCAAEGKYGVTTVVPETLGFIVPAPGPSATDFHLDNLAVPIAVPAGNYVAMISELVQASSKYAMRWWEFAV